LMRDWLDACYLFEPLLGFPVKWVALDRHPVLRCGSIQLRAFRTTHLDGLRKQFGATYPTVRFNAFSILATGGGKRLGYSADLGKPQDLVPLCQKPLDVLAVELAHFHPRALFEFLQPRDVRRVVVTHMGRPVRARLAEVKALARKALGPRRTRFVVDGELVRF
jgi:hypothetical protein